MKRVIFIINPKSGTGQKDAVERAITERMDATRYEVRRIYTEYAGHAVEIAAKEVEAGTDIVVAVGGDGTVNEVARALVKSNTALGIIPCGSGNGLARHLRIPLVPEEAVALINECKVENLDYGMANEEPFFCTFGVGFDAFISMRFASAGKRGLKTYIEKTLQDGINYKPETYHIEMDGVEETQDAFLITCANASQYGNNAYIAPHASTRDGLMDITILSPFNVLESPQIVMQMFNRTLNTNNHFKMFRTNHLVITRDEEGPAHIDGDPLTMGKRLDVRLIEGGIKVVVNGHPGHRPVGLPIFDTLEREWDHVIRQVADFASARHIPSIRQRKKGGLD